MHMSKQRINLARLVGDRDPLPEEIVLRYSSKGDFFCIYPGGFNKYGIRRVPGWRWSTNEWVLPADVDTLLILDEEFPEVLAIHESALEKVSQVLGYDPCDRDGGRPPLLGMAGETSTSNLEKIRAYLGLVEAEEPDDGDEDEVEDEDEDEIEGDEEDEAAASVFGLLKQAITIQIEQLDLLRGHSTCLLKIGHTLETLDTQVKSLQARDTMDNAERKSLDKIAEVFITELESVLPDFEQLSPQTQLIISEMCKVRGFLMGSAATDWTSLVNSCHRAMEHEAKLKVLRPVIEKARSSFRNRRYEDKMLVFKLGLGPRTDYSFNDLRTLLQVVSGQHKNTDNKDREVVVAIFEAAFPGRNSDLQDLSQEIEQHWLAYRNTAAHDGFLAAPQATMAIDEVIGKVGRPGLLSRVLALKN